MRTRRQFKPAFETLSLRLAPSATGAILNPMAPISTPGSGNPGTVDPMINPAPIVTPTTPNTPTPGPSGSYLPVLTSPYDPVLC
jgi:hypothetical protein